MKKIYLDTTMQIDRILGSNVKKNAIQAAIETAAEGDPDGVQLCCTTYVLGEFHATIMQDAVLVCQVLMKETELSEAEKRLIEVTRNRAVKRAQLIMTYLRESCADFEQMKCGAGFVLRAVLHRFHRGILHPLPDSTGCQRARAEITYNENGVPTLTGTGCDKRNCSCNIEAFWKAHSVQVQAVTIPDELNRRPVGKAAEKTVGGLLGAVRDGTWAMKGNDCRTLGDTVITLETRDGGGAVLTSNRGDYAPLCALFGVALYCPDYRDVYRAGGV